MGGRGGGGAVDGYMSSTNQDPRPDMHSATGLDGRFRPVDAYYELNQMHSVLDLFSCKNTASTTRCHVVFSRVKDEWLVDLYPDQV
jgi:hypothetical protein